MRVYGTQLGPILETLVAAGGISSIRADGTAEERALWRATLRHWLASGERHRRASPPSPRSDRATTPDRCGSPAVLSGTGPIAAWCGPVWSGTLRRCDSPPAARPSPRSRRPAVSPRPLLLPLTAPAAVAAAEPNFPSNMSGYHNLPEMVAEIQQAEASYPDLVDVFSIGKSYQGRDIWAAKVSDNVGTDEAEPEVLIDALHHAREHLSTEQALATLRWLTRDYATDSTVRSLVNGREIFIIFALNPDGMRYDLTGDPFRAWRKNRQPNAGTTAVGTDLNRNYGYKWGCCGGSSGSTSALQYRGAVGWSAPETRAFRDFVAEPGGRRRPADQGPHHAPHERRADPVAVRLHVPQRAAAT